MDKFYRTALLIGEENLKVLSKKKVIIFGVGGVGGYAFESLIRTGIKNITIVDNDVVNNTNINRQIIATEDSINKDKVQLIKERGLSINKDAKITSIKEFVSEDNIKSFDLKQYDYVIDCIDSVKSKISLIRECKENDVKIISALGAGNKLDLTKLEITDLSKTTYDPLAKVLRRELKKYGIAHLKVAFSKEKPQVEIPNTKEKIIPSAIFVPAAMGLLIGQEVVSDLIKNI